MSRRWLVVGTLCLALVTTSGCEFESRVCAGIGGVAIRLRAQDSQSGVFLGNVSAQATVAGLSGVVVTGITSPTDSTIVELRGGGGVYDVVVAKAGYATATKQVTVSGGGSCVPMATQDVVVALTRVP